MANLVYVLPHKLPNNLELWILGNKEILGKCEIWVNTPRPGLQPQAKSRAGTPMMTLQQESRVNFPFLQSPFHFDLYNNKQTRTPPCWPHQPKQGLYTKPGYLQHPYESQIEQVYLPSLIYIPLNRLLDRRKLWTAHARFRKPFFKVNVALCW